MKRSIFDQHVAVSGCWKWVDTRCGYASFAMMWNQ